MLIKEADWIEPEIKRNVFFCLMVKLDIYPSLRRA